ncbi:MULTISPECIES: 4-(cytidine 5'-diphospho)-2-C-methyl-D-erythritol kinase [unclassified Gilliamella]|uniref:4-(cytidine 5'-diphospho)-2-C-methyl-D-erythritol kinase n=1 Tax=unclassified Gilliamella TaxID=2685620 RepID=UPI00226ADDC9|nr:MULTISPECIES: 4-(cytidine 5'-diphospho)-2-C-methyl-D-erythritol kinase [unclassified Gilliamella]MCX8582686.1 4-(cytidine 5'-diphospho)-2-C-methyl-D-erythritol kinase [Gilliamella sp. B3372]MCX8594231.1 4-(cytidine 5'-diphospho)-2-C-methyl-D-erythritol kinase [Gilliamella sp. B3367]MCX8659735.1 4-(cytidine 5'-diphospho)-2-C-methyl-D-erythritol kinase [Gilliamella sp. B2772]MCX8669695.1 4-(cytidine 5'-diphospho)-2-C-methyl-D-erythritol kinase [Gilliamella sp. B2785]MCX8678420.1 4-(cytidine 5
MKHWLSPAKLNLFLYITGRRPDNYHNLQTLFQFIDVCDKLTFNVRNDGKIRLLTQFEQVPEDKNLITIAAQRLKSYANNSELGVDIAIEKMIPMGGGLGGASSNAATVLVALNQLWNLNIEQQTLITIGRSIGADVPIFIYGHSAFAEGIGDQFQQVDIPQYWYLVSCPNIEISTVKVFNDPKLQRDTPKRTIEQLMSIPFDKFTNDCEPIVRERYPQVDQLISYLSQFAPTRLTGTGACVFTRCDSKEQALSIQNELKSLSVKNFITKSLNLSPLYAD